MNEEDLIYTPKHDQTVLDDSSINDPFGEEDKKEEDK